MKRKISIIHPSRSRAKLAERTSDEWMRKSNDNANIEYIICLDTSDPKGAEYEPYFGHSFFKKCIRDNKSAIQAINEGAKTATGDIFIVVSDDFNEPPLHWDTLLLQEIGDSTDICVKTKDGIQNTMLTLPIMDRAYYNRFGYVYFGGYSHLFCDTEMTVVSLMLDRYVETDIEIPHNHHTIGKFKKDDVSKKCDATWNQGKKLFHERLKNNFGIKNPHIQFKDIVW